MFSIALIALLLATISGLPTDFVVLMVFIGIPVVAFLVVYLLSQTHNRTRE